MTTTLAIIALFIIIGTLYIFKDTITEALSEGNSFLPSEMKCVNDRRTYKNESSTAGKQNKTNKLLIVFLNTLRAIISIFVLILICIFIFKQLIFQSI